MTSIACRQSLTFICRRPTNLTSAIATPSSENNRRARYFRLRNAAPSRAIASCHNGTLQPDSHVEPAAFFNWLGISALRLTMPYHEERRPLRT